jgi:hypothetical protein
VAKSQNVVVKLGGLGMRFGMFNFYGHEKPPSSTELETAYRPYIETCIAAFGVNRSMLESNFPPDRASSSYPILWNAFKRLAAGILGLREGNAVRRHSEAGLPAGLSVRPKMERVFAMVYRHPRESGGPEPAPGSNGGNRLSPWVPGFPLSAGMTKKLLIFRDSFPIEL